MASKYLLTTLGCKVNQYEAEQLRETLESIGLRAAQPHETADLAVVNTCAVTVEAARKSRQAIRRAARGGEVPTIVVGCDASAEADVLRRIPGVIALIGHDGDICARLRSVVQDRLSIAADRVPTQPQAPADATIGTGASRDDVCMSAVASAQDPCDAEAADRAPSQSSIPAQRPSVNVGRQTSPAIHRFTGHQRAFLKVQDGCDAFCTYCIIPRLRPTLNSKPIPDAVEEASGLVRAGHREIVVTGIYLGAYGRPSALRRHVHDADSPLADLVETLAGVDGLLRLRLSSLEPGDVDGRLLTVMQRRACCVPHLHLPLQSGSDAILRNMNRQYTAGDYLDMIDRVQHALDRPAISTDVVVGFPGETDADFDTTLAIARQVGFSKVHAFPFSPRPGTAAANWADRFVEPAAVKHRMQRLSAVEQEMADRFMRDFVGQTERVIVEGTAVPQDPAGPDGPLAHGRSDRYFEVFFAPPAGTAPGDVVQVHIDRIASRQAYGTFIKKLA